MQLHKLNDNEVLFDWRTHTYMVDCKILQGITSTLVAWMFPDTYANIPKVVLDKAAEHGSNVHACIEVADTLGATDSCPESAEYLRMMSEHEMTCIEHEYRVSDNIKFASAIDLVLQNKNGEIVLGDIKTTSSLHEPKVAFQLNIYKYLFELCNPELSVKSLVEVWLPKPQYGKSKWVELPIVSIDVIEGAIASYLAGETPDKWLPYFDKKATTTEVGTIPSECVVAITALAAFERQAKAIKEQEEQLKEALLNAMREHGVMKWETSDMVISYVKPSKRTSLDSKKLQAEHPDVYSECIKESNISDSIRIKLK